MLFLCAVYRMLVLLSIHVCVIVGSYNRVPIRLNVAFRLDLAWWQAFIGEWNRVSFLTPPQLLPEWEMASDASGTWGCGAWHRNLWFQIPWDASTHRLPITVKELLPIIVAGALWGAEWAGHRIRCHCDNQAVVACLRSRTSRHKGLMHLLRTLVFVEAHFGFQFYPVYVDKHANHLQYGSLTGYYSCMTITGTITFVGKGKVGGCN